MSRTTYGVIAFKIPDGGLQGDELIMQHKKVVADMVKVLTDAGGSLTTVAEVAAKKMGPDDRLGEMSIKDAGK